MKQITIIKKQDDRNLGVRVLRVSLGGTPDTGYYMTYRGTLVEVVELLEDALQAAKSLKKEPEITPDMGKKYA